jgi:hypothetical protein
MMLAKGSTLRSTLNFIASEAGADARDRVLARLDEASREQVAATAATDEIPYELLLAVWRAAEAEIAPSHPGWAERAGGHAIESLGIRLYGGIVKKASPMEFLTQPVSLFRLYYQPGNMEVVEQEDGRAVVRLVGFPASDRLFCRRQTGGLRRAVELAAGREATARHTRCELEGDAFCEWELRWR